MSLEDQMARIRYVFLLLIAADQIWAERPNFDVLNKSIVKVRTHRDHPTGKEDEDETGTGFVVSAVGGVIRMLTAAHVVSNATAVEVTFHSDKVTSVPVRVLPQASDALDLAVLELRLKPGMAALGIGYPILNWVPRDGLSVSDQIWTVDGDWDPAPNSVIRLDHAANPSLFEYSSVSVGQGYSGAPVFSDRGLLVGIHVREAKRADYKISVAIRIDAALDTLDALGYTRTGLNAITQARLAPQNGPAQALKVDRPAPVAAPVKANPSQPVFWRDLQNNQLYLIRIEGGHLYISQSNGAVVADLSYGKNKKGINGFFGNSSLSTCPGSGYMEITAIGELRLDGRVEQKPTTANVNCGGVFGMLRSLVPIAFLKEMPR